MTYYSKYNTRCVAVKDFLPWYQVQLLNCLKVFSEKYPTVTFLNGRSKMVRLDVHQVAILLIFVLCIVQGLKMTQTKLVITRINFEIYMVPRCSRTLNCLLSPYVISLSDQHQSVTTQVICFHERKSLSKR